jgi:beta-N-acetylhexosaminidase
LSGETLVTSSRIVLTLTMVAVIVAGVVVAVRVLHRPGSGIEAGPASPGATATAASSPTPSAAPTLPPMTARQLAGQRIIYSYSGLTPPASLFEHIRKGEAAGVIFFGNNVSSPAQIASVMRDLAEAQRLSPIQLPLLLMTDQEGGHVRRLDGEPALSAKQVGLSANPAAAATQAGAGAAATLTAAGMNVNLAPVLDVYYSAGNFIDRDQRSFGSNATTVGVLGSNFLIAQQNAGAAATAKHFPGLGSAPRGANTDMGPVTLKVSLSDLRNKDELPYAAAIAAGVKLIMLSWAVYPALDPTRPAGLSPIVVGSELRGRLGFEGVTITDALEANGIQGYGGTTERAVLAARAGMDLLLCAARDADQGATATTALVDAMTAGQLDRTSFEAAVGRIIALRGSFLR